MALIKTDTELKSFVPLQAGSVAGLVLPFIASAESDYLIPFIGQDEYDELNAAYNASTLNSDQTKLLPLIQKAIAYFAYYLYTPQGSTIYSPQGIRIVTTDNQKTAFKWQIDQLTDQWRSMAYRGIESLLKFLDANLDAYDTYAASAAFTANHSLIINYADEFSAKYFIESNRDVFEALKPVMNTVEGLYIRDTLGVAYFNEYKDKILNDDLNTDDLLILDDLKTAIAHYTITRALSTRIVIFNSTGVIARSRIAGRSDGGFDDAPAAADQRGVAYRDAIVMAETYCERVSSFLNQKASPDRYYTYFNDTAVYRTPNPDTPPLFDNTNCKNKIFVG